MNKSGNNGDQPQVPIEKNLITSAMPLQLTEFAPVVNSNSTGTVNFVVNICPTCHIDIKNLTEVKNESTDHDALLEGIDVDDFFQ